MTDLAVGAQGGTGAVYLLFMNSDAAVKSHALINNAALDSLSISLSNADFFGNSLAAVDFDADGRMELVVGASGDDTGGASAGAVYIFFLESDGSIESATVLRNGEGGVPSGFLGAGGRFGSGLAPTTEGIAVGLWFMGRQGRAVEAIGCRGAAHTTAPLARLSLPGWREDGGV